MQTAYKVYDTASKLLALQVLCHSVSWNMRGTEIHLKKEIPEISESEETCKYQDRGKSKNPKRLKQIKITISYNHIARIQK